MGGQQSVSRNDIATRPLFYDTRKIPKSAFHMADKMLEFMGDDVSEDTLASLLKSYPRKLTGTTREFRPSKMCDIFQVISHDPKCKLHMNDRHVVLGIGEFSFLRFMPWATDLMVEHDPDLLAGDGTSLQLEICYYCLEDELKRCFPETANYLLHGEVYGIAIGATGKIEKPIFDVIKGRYKQKYRRTSYITLTVTSHHVQKVADDPRLKEIARNKDVTMVYLSLPPYIKVSIPKDLQDEFLALLDEHLGKAVDRDRVAWGGYWLEYPQDCDIDEIEQDQEEIDRQMVASAEIQHHEIQEKIQRVIDADILTYQLPE